LNAAREDWALGLQEAIGGEVGSTELLGVGNPIRSDDAVGLEIARTLRRNLGPSPRKGVRIHRNSLMPELLLSKLSTSAGRIVIFDAVEASKEPGEIVCSRLANTKYGYFATHNIPLRLVPGLAAREGDVYIVGVQPESLEVGEGLSDVVSGSAAQIIRVVTDAVRGRA